MYISLYIYAHMYIYVGLLTFSVLSFSSPCTPTPPPPPSSSFSQPDAKLAQLVGLPGEMSFRKGQTDKEFEKVCFESTLGVVHGPVQTQFGHHLILPKGRIPEKPAISPNMLHPPRQRPFERPVAGLYPPISFFWESVD
jgi:hypothetical protein